MDDGAAATDQKISDTELTNRLKFIESGIVGRGGEYKKAKAYVRGGLNIPAGSCAIVGNSGTIISTGLGDNIDGHDFVVRFNQFRTINYERDVGTKTSLICIAETIIPAKEIEYRRVMAENSCNILTKDDNIDFLIRENVDPARVYFWCNPKAFTRRSVYKIMSKICGNDFNHPRPPRSGVNTLALLFGSQLVVPPISIFGIEVKDNLGLGWKTQYYKETAATKHEHLAWHCPIELEFAMLHAMKDLGLIKIF